MPGYRTHDAIGLVTAIPMSSGVFTISNIILHNQNHALSVAGVFAVSHILNTILLSPDMDIDSRIYYRWGILRFIWWPYKQLVHHRSKFSHSAIGGLIRMVYILIFCAVILAAASMDTLNHISMWLVTHYVYALIVFLGSASASFIHVMADFWRPD